MKLAENESNSNTFWNDIKNLNAANKISPYCVDNINGPANIAELFKEKYSSIYTCVPTNDIEFHVIDNELSDRINCTTSIDYCISPTIVRTCI